MDVTYQKRWINMNEHIDEAISSIKKIIREIPTDGKTFTQIAMEISYIQMQVGTEFGPKYIHDLFVDRQSKLKVD